MNTRRSFLRALVAAVVMSPLARAMAEEPPMPKVEAIAVNPEWVSAGWEETYIFHPDVFTTLFPGKV